MNVTFRVDTLVIDIFTNSKSLFAFPRRKVYSFQPWGIKSNENAVY